MGAYQHISILFPNLEEKARSYNYPESSICVLSGDEEQLKANYPLTHRNLLSCSHNKDGRTYIEYGQDLVASWLFEDSLVDGLRSAGIAISFTGTDRLREILNTKQVSSSSDCIILHNEKSRPLELMSSYTDYWQKKGKLELRDDKYSEMVKTQSLLLGIETASNQYIILDFKNNIKAKFIKSHKPYGYKPAYSIRFGRQFLNEIDFIAIADAILRLL